MVRGSCTGCGELESIRLKLELINSECVEVKGRMHGLVTANESGIVGG